MPHVSVLHSLILEIVHYKAFKFPIITIHSTMMLVLDGISFSIAYTHFIWIGWHAAPDLSVLVYPVPYQRS